MKKDTEGTSQRRSLVPIRRHAPPGPTPGPCRGSLSMLFAPGSGLPGWGSLAPFGQEDWRNVGFRHTAPAQLAIRLSWCRALASPAHIPRGLRSLLGVRYARSLIA